MGGPPLTVADLCAMHAISHADVRDTSEAFLHASDAASYPLAAGFAVDVAAAVLASPFAARIVRDPLMGLVVRRAAVCSAVLRARPLEAAPGRATRDS